MTDQANTPLSLARDIEAYLFSEGGPVARGKICKVLGASSEEVTLALSQLAAMLEGSGLTLIVTDTEATLAVSPLSRDAIEQVYEGGADREIGDAGLEVLSILLYRGPSTRATIEHIRGVNSSSTIRTLLSRGLIERTENPADARELLYRATAETLAHLGVTDTEDLPEYGTIRGELAVFENTPDPFHAGDTRE